ncbi:MAG TPA: peroxiredoxin [Polyangia bacterium]|nr:peroxiredoxin [Polyangia bacterium]
MTKASRPTDTRRLAILALAALSGCAAQQRADGGKGLLQVGAPAPDLAGQTLDDRTVRLADVRGCPAVVYFYPRDGTPGCTKEACAFRDSWSRFRAAGVTIFGVSTQSSARHREFAQEHQLRFPLVADGSRAVQHAYGVPSAFLGLGEARVSFLIDPAGRIARVWPDVDPALHAGEVLSAAAALPGAAAPPARCTKS